MSLLGSIVQSSGGGGGSGTPGVIGEEAGSTAPNADANKKRLFLDTEKNNLLTAIDESGVLTIIDEFIDTPQTTAANLETNFPAASNNAVFAWISGTTSQNGLYLSDGSTWVKQLDNSGDISLLPDYAGGLTDGTVNISLESGTAYMVEDDLTTPLSTIGGGVAANAFDGSAGTVARVSDSGSTSSNRPRLYKIRAVSKICRKFIVKIPSNTPSNKFTCMGFSDATTEAILAPISINQTTGSGASIDGNDIIGLSVDDVVEVITSNTTSYVGYGVKMQGTANESIAEVEVYELIDNTDNIDCVGTIIKLHAGYGNIAPTALTADTLLDDTDGTVLLDPSGADFTMTLPAVATVLTGKKYTFVLTTAPATTAVTLDGASAETINGAATNASALTSQWDTVTIQSDGTQWIIV